MNAAELFVLSRRLMQLAESALPQGKVATSVRLVAADVAEHPDSSISEITTRTGFPQSHVSAAVSRLRDLGVLETEIDSTDRRRTLVRMTSAAVERAARVNTTPIEVVLAPAMTNGVSSEMTEVVEALELLARRLTPKALAHMRSGVRA
jgi:DNA-binding MarR family transcriptional regulator